MINELMKMMLDQLGTPAARQQLSALTGASEAATGSAMGTIVPAILAALGGQATTPTGARDLTSMIENADDGLLSNLPAALSGAAGTKDLLTQGASLVSMLFGGRSSSIVDALASATGIGGTSMSSLLKILAPLAITFLARMRRTQNVPARAVVDQLGREAPQLMGMLPAGLGSILRSAVDGSDTHGRAAPVVPPTAASAGAGAARWLIPAVAIAALLWLGTSLFGRPDSRTARLPDVAAATKQGLSARTVGNSLHLDLSGDALFETAQSDVRANANDSLTRVAEIISAYPDGMVEIRGYTDNVGDPAANVALSKRRAESVQQWLATRGGIKTQSVTTQGLGSSDPVASNETEEGRKQNRRVEVVVSKR